MDGLLFPLDEDVFVLDRVSADISEEGVVRYYFGWRTSARQALRLLAPETPFALRELFMWGGPSGSLTIADAPELETAGDALQWLNQELDHYGDLINLTCLVGNQIELSTHDNTEVTMKGSVSPEMDRWAASLLKSLGFDPTAILGAMNQNGGNFLAIQKPATVLGVFDTFEALNKAHPEG
ncbi:MAG: hypothetical protein JST24_06125 [Acidobacteria bacterium]|nr:hypothetical protein [Acidobacteriota bacterium]